MATKLANMHTAGIFADPLLDGPNIGTLVLVIDRAKNLPNRKGIGKQSPYCAARLGKEAKKTETDKRGGQTPKWDQELRFDMHDSPDFHNLKISVFSEDNRRTDLIGEAWVRLSDIVVPGGGKGDLWQGLTCKGKYAGELRIELTYYDSRPKPEGAPESFGGELDLGRGLSNGTRIKRRPLPNSPNGVAELPSLMPDPGRAKHGPRDYGAPPRSSSMPPDVTGYPQQQPLYSGPPPMHQYGSSPPSGSFQPPQPQYYGEQTAHMEPEGYNEPTQQPDFLPQLPPTNRLRLMHKLDPKAT